MQKVTKIALTDVLDRLYNPQDYTWLCAGLMLSWKVANQMSKQMEGKTTIDYVNCEFRKDPS